MKNVMVIDAEFNQPSGKTIEIAAAIFSPNTGELIDTFTTYVDPGEPISQYIIDLTGITDEKVKGAPYITDAYLLLKEFHLKNRCVQTPIVWGSGVRNDSQSLYEEANIVLPNGEKMKNFMGYRVIDAKTIFQSLQIFNGRNPVAGLEKACSKLGIKFDGTPHVALSDAINTFRVWHFLVTKFDLSIYE